MCTFKISKLDTRLKRGRPRESQLRSGFSEMLGVSGFGKIIQAHFHQISELKLIEFWLQMPCRIGCFLTFECQLRSPHFPFL